MKTITACSATLALAIAAGPALAHHGFGRFDITAEIRVEGTLTDLEFVNPHSYVYFNATGADGATLQMHCEMRAATVLRRSGWTPDMFVPGARVVIEGRPHRDDPTSCYVETLTIGDAPTLERYQQLDDAPAVTSRREPRLPSGVPNIFGDWAQEQYLMAQPSQVGARGVLVPKSMVAAVEAGTIDPADVPPSNWGARPVTLTTAGEAAAEVLRNEPPELNPRITCQITSIIFDWVFDGPINRITRGDNEIVIDYGRDLTRTIHMNMDSHPAGIAPSRAGHSIGRWDGDTLVIDTIGFSEGRLVGTVPSSSELHIVERFRLDADGTALVREYVAEDPLYFAEPYTGSDIVLPADAPFAVDECEELAYEYTTGVNGN